MAALDLRVQNILLPVIHLQKHQEEHYNIPEGDQALIGDPVRRDLNMDYRSLGHQPDFSPLQLFDDPGRPIADTITRQALHELVDTFMTKKQLMTVVNNRLTEEGGVAAGVKDQNLGSLNADLEITSEMKEKVV